MASFTISQTMQLTAVAKSVLTATCLQMKHFRVLL